MKESSFLNVFFDLLSEVYDCEVQIVENLPTMIQAASNKDLKTALSSHLKETKIHVERLDQIFEILGHAPKAKRCKAIKGIINDAEIELGHATNPAVRDVAIIISGQKIEHFEIASYGSLIALCNHFEKVFKDEVDFRTICNHLEDTLHEEKAADKKLTTLAEGRVFAEGINDEAEKELRAAVAVTRRR